MPPPVLLDGGVDDDLDDHLGPDLRVAGGRAGSAPAGRGQHLGPRVAGPDLGREGRREGRAGGRGQLGGTADEVELPVGVVPAEE